MYHTKQCPVIAKRKVLMHTVLTENLGKRERGAGAQSLLCKGLLTLGSVHFKDTTTGNWMIAYR